jgi:hypothetical protein
MANGAHEPQQDSEGDMADLERALLRRGVDSRLAGRERCSHCRRTPLIGERVYVHGPESIFCELCRSFQPQAPAESRLIHGPAFGHSLRSTQRAA